VGTDTATSGDENMLRQVAPYPVILAGLVERLRYRRDLGWQVWLEDDLQRDKPGRHAGESRGMTLVVQRRGRDTYHPERTLPVNHYFAVPAATYNEQSWTRWLFDRLGDVDTHERMEDFAFVSVPHSIKDGRSTPQQLERPLAPNHGPGWDPYLVTFVASETDRRTSFRGELNPR
jgi:hypothetical protein